MSLCAGALPFASLLSCYFWQPTPWWVTDCRHRQRDPECLGFFSVTAHPSNLLLNFITAVNWQRLVCFWTSINCSVILLIQIVKQSLSSRVIDNFTTKRLITEAEIKDLLRFSDEPSPMVKPTFQSCWAPRLNDLNPIWLLRSKYHLYQTSHC